jgi:YfiH family protein
MSARRYHIFSQIPGLYQVFSTRSGGNSSGAFKGLNLGLHTKDNPADILQNRSLFYTENNVPADRLVFPEQVHGDRITEAFEPGVLPKTDAVFTTCRNLFLTIQTADCYPVFIADIQARVCAVVHSGWRGTAANICGKTIRQIETATGITANEILVAIGPGICQENYQVDHQTAAFFDPAYLQKDGPNHFRLDLLSAIYDQIRRAGVSVDHIETDGACTFTEQALFYSYRRDAENSGRMMGIISLI